ncbi:hypothetical protein ACF0H5_023432 [Mactra antiquata]
MASENNESATKTETKEVNPADVEKQVIRQMEHYFGDYNLPKDRFLLEQIKLDDGWVPLETMLKFNRLKQICDSQEKIAEYLRKSTAGLLEVSEDGTKVRRNPERPLPENTEERKKEIATRTIYAKVFPLDATLDELRDYFEIFGEVDVVVMRKDIHKKFKGSVFVTYRNVDSVKKFLEPETMKYKEVELEKRMMRDDYTEMKDELRKQLKEEKQKKKTQATERQKNDGDKKIQNEMVKGALLHFANIADGVSREDIRNKLERYGPIAWVDFCKGETEAVIRYEQENKAADVLEKALADNDNVIKFNNEPAEGKVLEGDAAVVRWKKMSAELEKRRQKKFTSKNFQKGKWGKRPSKATREAMKYVSKVEAQARKSALDGEPPVKKSKSND